MDSERSAQGVTADLGAMLSPEVFESDPRVVALELLGKTLAVRDGEVVAGGKIVEVEAYLGAEDPGSHAATRGITPRNATMYGPPGSAYVYLSYGIHHMLNVVCLPDGLAGAVLIRAIEPLIGIDVMARRRGTDAPLLLARGPGRLTSALGVTMADNASVINAGRVEIHDGPPVPKRRIATTGRIGLSAGQDLPLRYHIAQSRYVSR
ncbi:MAG: DNA-3-methyladenine glycosylase [Actinobacteria bacterium]|nr:DNA-3-methyladenine glycosylase [Actinomycetota bacterium]MCL5886798.1 DNA-3-methyladenine glycosylase [Actinomycetota bacterium]